MGRVPARKTVDPGSSLRPVLHGPDVAISTPPTISPDIGTSYTSRTEDKNLSPDLYVDNPRPLSQDYKRLFSATRMSNSFP